MSSPSRASSRAPFRWLRTLSGRVLIAVLVCALVMAFAVYRANQYIDEEVAKIPRIQLTTAENASSSGQNFLIIGSDTRSFVQSEEDRSAYTDSDTTTDGPSRSDTMMVLHADGKNSYAVSFPRDLWVNIPNRGNMKLNAAFNDGPQAVIDTISSDFGVPINHYLEVNFATFASIVDAVGTVPVYFPYQARDQLTGLNAPYPGCYHLDGAASLAYVRSRHLEYFENGKWVDASPLADLDRIQRQQAFIKKLGRIAVAGTMDDPTIAPDLADKVIPKLAVDDSFDRASFNALIQAFLGLADGDGGLTFATLPWDGPATRDGQSVLLVKQPDADHVFSILKGETPAPTPTSTTTATSDSGSSGSSGSSSVRPVDVRVQVLNGSGVQGAAGEASQALTQLGFPSGGIGNDTRGTVAKTEIRYKPGQESHAALVGQAVPGATLVADSSLSGTDVVLGVGKSFPGVAKSLTPATTAAPGGTAPVAPADPAAACDAS
ncbi:MAG: LCP family protein [Acidimicrobiia bacterium]